MMIFDPFQAKLDVPMGSSLLYLLQCFFSKGIKENGLKGSGTLWIEFVMRVRWLKFLIGSNNLIALLLNFKESIQLFFQPFENYPLFAGRGLRQELMFQNSDVPLNQSQGRHNFM